MRGLLTAAFILGVSVALGAQQPTFRSGTQTVPLYITVTDSAGRLVPNLTKEDFTILDNGVPQEISVFDNTVRPITSVVMLDTSGSMTLNLDLMKAAAEQFVLRLLPEDKAIVGAFNNKVEFANTGFTNDRDDLTSAIRELDYGNATRLWDAIDLSLEQLQGIDGRRVVVVFTDGDDQGSSSSQGKVIDRSRADEVMIYAIGLESVYMGAPGRMVRTRPAGGLRRIADETGGGYFELKKTEDLGPAFTRVAQELHSQYLLAFTPKNLDGKVHKLEVRPKDTANKARARRSYVATAVGQPASGSK
jgi:Ca-activated chloride channel family protein